MSMEKIRKTCAERKRKEKGASKRNPRGQLLRRHAKVKTLILIQAGGTSFGTVTVIDGQAQLKGRSQKWFDTGEQTRALVVMLLQAYAMWSGRRRKRNRRYLLSVLLAIVLPRLRLQGKMPTHS